jgi:molybdopterin synthase catalytic subunit
MMAHIIKKGEKTVNMVDLQEFVKKNNRINECGAIYTFEGIVRGKEPGKTTTKMKLNTPHRENTQKELEKIINQTKDKFGVIQIAVVHYVGEFEVGDSLFLTAVAGSHRGETQKALNEIVERVKYELDFKKEEFTPGGTNIIMSGG